LACRHLVGLFGLEEARFCITLLGDDALAKIFVSVDSFLTRLCGIFPSRPW
jgi:hypothetical protein